MTHWSVFIIFVIKIDIMKSLKVFLLLLTLISLTTYSQTNSYSNGWKAGYKAGYCYQQYGCVAPIAPVSPVAMAGKDTYQDGYNRGFTKGKSDNTNSNSTNNGGAYGQLKPLKNTNTGSIVQEHISHTNQSSNKRRSRKQKSLNTELSLEDSKTYFNDLTFDEILSFQKNNLVFVEEFLTANNWSFKKGSEPTDSKIGMAEFGTIDFDDATLYLLTYYYFKSSTTRRISLIFPNKKKYDYYLNEIKKEGYKHKSSFVEGNSFIKIYQNETRTFRLMTSSTDSSTGITFYGFILLNNDDYKLNFKE